MTCNACYHKINEHGVILGGEVIVLADAEIYHAEIEVAEHPVTGKWYFGLDVYTRSGGNDSFGHSFAPSLHHSPSLDTRQDAIDAAVEYLNSDLKDRVERASSYADGSPREMNPTILRAIEKIITSLSEARQLVLFQEATLV